MTALSTSRHQSTNIHEMIARFGIDLGDKRHGLLHATALRRCRACPNGNEGPTWRPRANVLRRWQVLLSFRVRSSKARTACIRTRARFLRRGA